MTGDGKLCVNVSGQPGGFAAIEVSRNPAFRPVPINGQESDIYLQRAQDGFQPLMPKSIPAVIKNLVPETYDVPQEPTAALCVTLYLVVRGGYSYELNAADFGSDAGVDAHDAGDQQ